MIILYCFRNTRAAFRCSSAFNLIEKIVTVAYTNLSWSFLKSFLSLTHSCTLLCALPVPLSMNCFRKTGPTSGVLVLLCFLLFSSNLADNRAKWESQKKTKKETSIFPLKEQRAAPAKGKKKWGKEVDLERRRPQELALLLLVVPEYWEGRDIWFWKRMLPRVIATLCISPASKHHFPWIWHNQSRQWGDDCFTVMPSTGNILLCHT